MYKLLECHATAQKYFIAVFTVNLCFKDAGKQPVNWDRAVASSVWLKIHAGFKANRSILRLSDETEGKTVLRVIAHKGVGSPCTLSA